MVVLGRYELVHKIATGGMADVFLARQWGDGHFQRPALIKRMHSHLAEIPATVLDFQNEAMLLASLDHPAIPKVFDFRFVEGVWILVMEHVAGPTLGACRRAEQDAGRVTPWPVAFNVVVQLCEVLSEVHRHTDANGRPLELIHGDLSPENLILGRNGQLRLVDFGLAGSAEHRQTQREHVRGMRGTVGYVSPECIEGAALDHRSDQYVVGTLLYEMTTGRRVFEGDDMAVMESVRTKDPVPPSQHREGYPKPLEELVLRALRRDPGLRHPSLREMGLAMRNLAARAKLPIRHEVLSQYAESYFPRSGDVGLPVAPYPDRLDHESVPPLPDLDAEEGALTAREREEVLADLDDFLAPLGETEDELEIDDLLATPLERDAGALEAPHTQTRARRPPPVPPDAKRVGEED